MILLYVYFTGLIVTLLFDLSIDLATSSTIFDIKWIKAMIFSFTCWPYTVPANVIMTLYLRKKGIYTFRYIKREED